MPRVASAGSPFFQFDGIPELPITYLDGAAGGMCLHEPAITESYSRIFWQLHWSIADLAASHLRCATTNADRIIRWLSATGVAGVATVAMVVSHAHGDAWRAARLIPLTPASTLRERLGALHLVGQLGLDYLHGDHIRRDAKVVHQGLGDVQHHVLLLLISPALGHEDVYFRHVDAPSSGLMSSPLMLSHVIRRSRSKH
jgi:hypothetical protein